MFCDCKAEEAFHTSLGTTDEDELSLLDKQK